MQRIKPFLTSLALVLVTVSPALAVDTSKAYNSGILVLLFVGFCALLIIAQLVPALLALFGLTKQAAQSGTRKQATVSAKKQ
jgi:hypothetical protein